MRHLDLTQLPRELQAFLGQHFDSDEAKRRALLAPWCAARCSSLWPQGVWAWRPRQRFWRRTWAREIREGIAPYLALKLELREGKPSIFSPALPYFPTPLTEVAQPLRSPWPEVLSDAEYWAFVMQLHEGDEAWAQRRLERWVQPLREAAHPAGLKRLHFWHSRSSVLADMHWLMSSENAGDYL